MASDLREHAPECSWRQTGWCDCLGLPRWAGEGPITFQTTTREPPRWPERPVDRWWHRDALPLLRPLAAILTLWAPMARDDLAVTLACGLVFVGLCCWRP